MPSVSACLDLATRKWWRLVGRPIDTAGEHAWLRAPVNSGSRVADAWLADEAAYRDGEVREGVPGAGLVPEWAVLAGPGFDPDAVRPEIRDFYEHTSRWRMEVWSSWSPLFWPGGELVSRLFGKRVQQLALPMRPLDAARGMDSRVSIITDATGRQAAAGWLRTLRSTGEYVFSGCYSLRTLPGASRPSVHVTFPLESGNVQVFLQPRNGAGGGFVLESAAGGFGEDGAYVVVREGGRMFAKRVPIHETFHLFVDEEGVLRTDHVLRIRDSTAVRLHYRLERGRDVR